MKFTAKDIRFNKKDNIVYATVMGIPEKYILIKNLGTSNTQNIITNIELLGSTEKMKWNQNNYYLIIERPDNIPNDIAIVFKIHLK
jgi:alpha-L-fucosidase